VPIRLLVPTHVVVRQEKDCSVRTCDLPLVSEARSSTGQGDITMLCSVCAGPLVSSEIRDRHGTPFLAWQCPRVIHHLRASTDTEVSLWRNLRPAAPILLVTLIAVATMLLSF
jgi:hypothetical protein